MNYAKCSFLICSLSFFLGLVGCSRVSKVEPYLNGVIEGVFGDMDENEFVPIRLELSVSDVGSKSYKFAGTLLWDDINYEIQGSETTSDDALEYLTPQDRALLGRVEGKLLRTAEQVYCLHGRVINGTASGQGRLPQYLAEISIFTPDSEGCETIAERSKSLGELRF